MRPCLALAALFLSFAACAQSPAPAAGGEAPAAKAAPIAARIAEVAWLAGYWTGTGLGGVVEDVWLPPKSGVLLGAFRLTKPDGKPGFYELFAIEEVDGTLEFVVKHFNPDWVGWEEKDKALRARLTRLSGDEIAFGGIVFRRTGPDGFTVTLAMRGKNGELRHEKLSYTRRPL